MEMCKRKVDMCLPIRILDSQETLAIMESLKLGSSPRLDKENIQGQKNKGQDQNL